LRRRIALIGHWGESLRNTYFTLPELPFRKQRAASGRNWDMAPCGAHVLAQRCLFRAESGVG
jgi:hypothetical protein